MRIEKITLREINLPLKEPFRISSGVTEKRRIALLELQSSDGVIEWSECVAGEEPNYSYETIDTAWHAIVAWIAPRILGRTWNDPREIHPLLEAAIRGHGMAKAAVEMGAWGLAAKSKGVPLARFIGGVKKEIEVGISIGIQSSPDLLARKVRDGLGKGYRKIKMKIEPGKDVEYVGYVRSTILTDTHLMVDANNAYTEDDFDQLKKLDDFDLLMIEQPLSCDDLVRHAKLQKILRTPLCLDESITSPERAQDMIELGSGRIVNIKPGRVGGFASSIAIHDICARNSIPVWCGGMLESGIGRAYNVALASLPNFSIPGDISPSDRYWERDIVSPAWTMSDRGTMKVPDHLPGIGITIDVPRIESLCVKSQILTA